MIQFRHPRLDRGSRFGFFKNSWIPAFAAMTVVGGTSSAAAQPQAAPAAVNYALDQNWLCLPGRKDVCSTPLATAPLGPSGYGATGLSSVANDPPIDCFYVYPTVSDDPGMNSDLIPGAGEKLWTQQQFAGFSAVCRPFVPIYRQMTLAAIMAYSTGADVHPYAELAYSDVLAAWRSYLRDRNNGRPFVLIGHSQGSLMLQQLIAREIETNPAVLARMKLAIIPGYNVLVPQGRLVGGTFKKVPLCSQGGEGGCVIAYSSFREKNEPPAGAMFGIADQPGMTVGCVNPALPGSRDWVKLDSDWYTRSPNPVPGGPIHWSSQGQPSTPYVRTRGLVSGKCVNDGPRGYLSIRTNSRAGEQWTDHVGGEIAVLGLFLPGWGMHLSDIAEAEGDLIRDVAAVTPRSRTAGVVPAGVRDR